MNPNDINAEEQGKARQEKAVAKLEAQGWQVKHVDDDTVYLSRRDRKIRSLTHMCQVGPDGEVN